MAKTIAELDAAVAVHANRLDAVEELSKSSAAKSDAGYLKHEREIAILMEQNVAEKADNAILRTAIERLENRLWALAVTTIFSMLSAFVAVAVAVIKK